MPFHHDNMYSTWALARRDVVPTTKLLRNTGDRVTCQFIKETPNTIAGLGITQLSDGSIVISKIRPGSPAAGTALKPGMIVKSINGISCVRIGYRSATGLLEEAVGRVTVIAKTPSSIMAADEVSCNSDRVRCRPALSKRWGIQLLDSSRGSIAVSNIIRRSAASKTKLAPLMTLKRVGDKSCSGMKAADVAKLLDGMDGDVSLRAVSVDGQSRRIMLDSRNARTEFTTLRVSKTGDKFDRRDRAVKKWFRDLL